MSDRIGLKHFFKMFSSSPNSGTPFQTVPDTDENTCIKIHSEKNIQLKN